MENNMQNKIIFVENSFAVEAPDRSKIFRSINPVQKFRQYIEESDWDIRLIGYEKYLNRFSWAAIITSVLYLIPICANILL
jgi:hypothetical protein